MRIWSDVAQVPHASNDPVSSDFGSIRIGQRIKRRGCLRQAGKHGHLGQREFFDRFVVVNLCRCSDPVSSIAEVDLIQIELEDAVFVQFALNLKSQKYLVELPDKGPVP